MRHVQHPSAYFVLVSIFFHTSAVSLRLRVDGRISEDGILPWPSTSPLSLGMLYEAPYKEDRIGVQITSSFCFAGPMIKGTTPGGEWELCKLRFGLRTTGSPPTKLLSFPEDFSA